MPHPRRGCVRQNENKQSRLVIHAPRKTQVIRTRGPRDTKITIRKFQNYRGSKRTKKKEHRGKSERAAAVGGTSSMDMFHLLLIVGLVPFYPVCRHLPTFAQHGFPYTPPVAPPPSPSSFEHHTRRMHGTAYSGVPYPRATSP